MPTLASCFGGGRARQRGAGGDVKPGTSLGLLAEPRDGPERLEGETAFPEASGHLNQ